MFSNSPCIQCGKTFIFGGSSRLCASCANTLDNLETFNPLKHSPLFESSSFEDVSFKFSDSPQSGDAFELLVGLIGIDSVAHFQKNKAHKTAFELLNEAVEALSKQLAQKKFPQKQEWKGLILAPEFFFHRSEDPMKKESQLTRRPINSDDLPHRCLDEMERDTLIQKCKTLSSQHPSILIVPGSFLYRKPLNDKRKDKATRTVSNVEKKLAEKNIWTIYKQTVQDEGSPYFVGTNGTYIIEEEKFVNLEGGFKRDNIEDTLRKIEEYDYMLRNTVYGFYGGEVVLKYHKVGLNADINAQDDNLTRTVFVSGGGKNIKKFLGVRIGVEICLDHDLGLLKKLNPNQTVDLHLIASGSVDNRPEHFCQSSNGFVLHADSNQEPRGVYDGSNSPLKADTTVDLKTRVAQGTRTLTLYTIQLKPSK